MTRNEHSSFSWYKSSLSSYLWGAIIVGCIPNYSLRSLSFHERVERGGGGGPLNIFLNIANSLTYYGNKYSSLVVVIKC